MAQYDFGTIDPNTKSGTALASDLNSWRNALHSTHGGSTAPTYLVAGMLWADTTSANYELKMYDGAQWIQVAVLDATNNVARVAVDSAETSYITSTTAAQIRHVIASTDIFTTRSTGIQFNIASPVIADSNNNELVSFTTTASAVNQIDIANAATGGGPVLSAVGGDTNIDIILTPKGTGNVVVASGNVGIGTASPSYKLDVYGSGSQTVAVRAATSGDARFYTECAGTNSGWMQYTRSLEALQFSANGSTQHLTLNSSGNLGLGVTPSAWSGLKAFEIAGVGSGLASASNNNLFLSANAWFNGTTWRYGVSAEATQYQSFEGAHKWYTAPSGTAGNAITFTQAMTLDASGNLLVNRTGPDGSAVFQVATKNNYGIGVASGVTTTQYVLEFRNANGVVGTVTTSGSSTTYATSSDYRLKENVAPMQNALDTVAQLNPVTYTWKADGSAGQGFIAHELQAVVPECVTGEKDAMREEQYEVSPAVPATYDDEGNVLTEAVEAVTGTRMVPAYQGIDTSFLVATLTKAIQEQQTIIEELTARVAALEA